MREILEYISTLAVSLSLVILISVRYLIVLLTVPLIPGLPKPGTWKDLPPLATLVTLENFTVTSNSTTHQIQARANATTINPLPQRGGIIGDDFHVTVPSLDFVVALPNDTVTQLDGNSDDDEGQHRNFDQEPVTVAIGKSDPFVLRPSESSTPKNITLTASAHIPSLLHSSTPVLSHALSLYLSARPIPILITSPLLPSYRIPFLFPPPPERPQLLRDVVIKDVRVGFKGEVVVASGEVVARVVLPGEGRIRVGVDARGVWPDVLIFDGEVPEDGEESELGSKDIDVILPTLPVPVPTLPVPTPKLPLPVPQPLPRPQLPDLPEFPLPLPKFPSHHKGANSSDPPPSSSRSKIPKPPLPTPLPPRAFARIRPEDWLDASSVPLPDIIDSAAASDEPVPPAAYQYLVSSRFADIPLEVLPGREELLRKFVTKVVFGGQGAVAGVKGVAGVAAVVEGVKLGGDGDEETEVELRDIPVQGMFRVGKKGWKTGR
jgi:hypothetical protein